MCSDWLIKNSWSTKFANQGYIKVARGINCASMCRSPGICGHLFTVGDPALYYERDPRQDGTVEEGRAGETKGQVPTDPKVALTLGLIPTLILTLTAI